MYQSCLTLCNPLDCSPQGSSVHGIFQARILEWVSISFSRESSQPRNQTHVNCVSCIASGFFTCWAIREAHSVTGTDLIVRLFTLSMICFPLTFYGSVSSSWATQRPKCGLSSIGKHLRTAAHPNSLCGGPTDTLLTTLVNWMTSGSSIHLWEHSVQKWT